MGAESLEASNSTLDCVLCRAQAHTLLIIIDDGSFDISPVEGDMGLFQWHAVNRLSNGCEYIRGDMYCTAMQSGLQPSVPLRLSFS